MKQNKEDKAILKSYEGIVDTIAIFMGIHCEVALYSAETEKGKLIKIVNNNHTKREIGSNFTEQGLQIISDYKETNQQSLTTYITSDYLGNPMRSVFYVITNMDKIIGLLDINFNMNIPLAEFISEFSLFHTPIKKENNNEYTNQESVEALVHKAVNEIVIEISTNISIPNHEKNKYIVYGLYKKGIFDIKGSVVMVAKELKLSKYTIYSYIRELKEKKVNL